MVEALGRGEPVDLGALPPPPGEFSGMLSLTLGKGGRRWRCDVQCTKCTVLLEHSNAKKLSACNESKKAMVDVLQQTQWKVHHLLPRLPPDLLQFLPLLLFILLLLLLLRVPRQPPPVRWPGPWRGQRGCQSLWHKIKFTRLSVCVLSRPSRPSHHSRGSAAEDGRLQVSCRGSQKQGGRSQGPNAPAHRQGDTRRLETLKLCHLGVS